jgi:hypothetical protein
MQMRLFHKEYNINEKFPHNYYLDVAGFGSSIYFL